jgi:NAD(P)H dehydrogenase (quinone)
MKHAVILAHPKSNSFCAALADVYAAAVHAGGDMVTVRDLYALDFDPRLKASEMPSPAGYAPGGDVARERNLLRDADVICFVYPFWFNAPPAMLKGYIDRVLSMDFGYRFHGRTTAPGLVGRRLFSISTSGAPDHWVAQTGALRTLVAQMDMHLAGVTGMSVAGHLHFGAIQSDLNPDDAELIFEEIRQAVRALAIEPV